MLGFVLRDLNPAEELVLCLVWGSHEDQWDNWFALLTKLLALGFLVPADLTNWEVWDLIFDVEYAVCQYLAEHEDLGWD